MHVAGANDPLMSALRCFRIKPSIVLHDVCVVAKSTKVFTNLSTRFPTYLARPAFIYREIRQYYVVANMCWQPTLLCSSLFEACSFISGKKLDNAKAGEAGQGGKEGRKEERESQAEETGAGFSTFPSFLLVSR